MKIIQQQLTILQIFFQYSIHFRCDHFFYYYSNMTAIIILSKMGVFWVLIFYFLHVFVWRSNNLYNQTDMYINDTYYVTKSWEKIEKKTENCPQSSQNEIFFPTGLIIRPFFSKIFFLENWGIFSVFFFKLLYDFCLSVYRDQYACFFGHN